MNRSFFSATPTGFQIFLANGVIVSVQFGKMNYCENRGRSDAEYKQCKNAEVWVFTDYGIDATDVRGYVSPETLAVILARAAELPDRVESADLNRVQSTPEIVVDPETDFDY